MEQYDYRKNPKTTAGIGLELDRLSVKQLQAVAEAVEDIKRAGNRNDLVQYSEWFDKALLLFWKEFAERTSSLLEVEREGDGIITILLRNSTGIDVMENCRAFYMLLVMASGITLQADSGDINLVMTYDCKKFIN